MAQYQHLPIYKATYDLLQVVTRVVRHYPRDFKHTLGIQIRDEVVGLIVEIYRANSCRDMRADSVARIVERMQVIELLIRLSRDMQLMSVKQFSDIVMLTDSVVRQAQGWLKSVKPSSAE